MRNRYETYKGYIIDREKNFYNTWIMNKDSAQKPILPFEIDKEISENDLSSFLKAADYAMWVKNDSIDKKKYVFLKNKKWFYLYSSHSIYTKKFHENNPFPVSNFYENTNITMHLDHFLKVSTTRSFWDHRNFSYGGSGGSGGSNGSVYWGIAYCHINFKGKRFNFLMSSSTDAEGNNIEDDEKISMYVPKSKRFFVLNGYNIVTLKN